MRARNARAGVHGPVRAPANEIVFEIPAQLPPALPLARVYVIAPVSDPSTSYFTRPLQVASEVPPVNENVPSAFFVNVVFGGGSANVKA